ncbi:dihydrofolate reductase family protein [Pseudonocardia humida]|uniref:Dihydrofolate reductase n=1 Tax=Pseudonocardia humida TaxID=2800819 RepID=A0ABT1A1M1_9PSEU|nr:dihydrofolate reductase family protein [Pseudonocardia humida]MCO1656856.1 dihydrofolate reductase [Pseudonocardia humida]
MRKLVYYVATTLDGFIAGPDGADPTGPDGFWPIPADYVRHLAAEYPETLPAPARAALSVTAEGTRFDTVLEGRRSYGIGLAAGITDAFPHLRHLVFSRTLTESPDPAVELVADDPAATVRQLKQEDGKDIWLIGGAELAGALYREIDQLILKMAPLTIGAGIPLFSQEAAFDPRSWELTGHTVLDSGAAFVTYARHRHDVRGGGTVTRAGSPAHRSRGSAAGPARR